MQPPAPRPVHCYTTALTPGQVQKLREVLEGADYEFETKPYTLFCARKGKLNIVVYEKGPKAVIQGKGIEDFITFQLEPNVLSQASFGYAEVLHPERYEPHFGIDESGKGDFFGPLVIAGTYVDRDLARAFASLGVQDSKNISSDKRIRDLAQGIRQSGAPLEIIVLSPPQYNDRYVRFGTLNKLLAWGHARVLENLCEKRPDCPRALSDKFANVRVLERALMPRGKSILLDQRTKAESDFAVAAASILAREKFIDWLDAAATRHSLRLPRGASQAVKIAALAAVHMYGPSILPKIAKTHFKTTAEVLSDFTTS